MGDAMGTEAPPIMNWLGIGYWTAPPPLGSDWSVDPPRGRGQDGKIEMDYWFSLV